MQAPLCDLIELPFDGLNRWSWPRPSPVVSVSASLATAILDSATVEMTSGPSVRNAPDSDHFLTHHGMTDSEIRGRRIGPYVLLEPLGAGSQAVVWRARADQPSPRVVALKILTGVRGLDPRRLARFRREAERGRRLAGLATLPVVDFGMADGVAYMAMPVVEGDPLSEVITRRRGDAEPTLGRPHWLNPLAEAVYLRAVLRIMEQIARALARAHAASVAHRDIKPANILVDRDRSSGGAYLTDFGLGRELNIATPEQLQDGAGTPLYMAPEKLRGGPRDERLCDIYALGVTLFEAVTLIRPFQVPNGCPLPALASCLLAQRPLRPRTVCPGLPRSLESLIERAMASDPSDRYPTAEALADDLQRFLVTF
ncbi:serine/threonine-protein kinase [Tautonia marina]|uniref:serine/threonine-protein kinase n=1 Tax=Tautonia marina TaxID=2653855 RepID=UPI001260C948|nr:serine/threonine-protein kinase [Tautonia marina]